jgi:hypothetical protein
VSAVGSIKRAFKRKLGKGFEKRHPEFKAIAPEMIGLRIVKIERPAAEVREISGPSPSAEGQGVL